MQMRQFSVARFEVYIITWCFACRDETITAFMSQLYANSFVFNDPLANKATAAQYTEKS